MTDLDQRIKTLAQLMFESKHLVVFTGAGISTESGLPDFRGPNGLWTRQAKGLPSPKFDWEKAKPNQNHYAIVELQNLGKLAFLISQNVDNFHLASGIRPDLLAELHGNKFKSRCRSCGFKCDAFPDLTICPQCGGELASSVVDFGDPLPLEDVEKSEGHSRNSDLFIVVGSSLVVYPAADMPKIALESGAKLVIINQGDVSAEFERACHLRFRERIGEVLPPALIQLKELIKIGDPPSLAASALIIHGGKILFVQRAKEPTKGKWAFPGGQVQEGETSEKAAVRETKEEVGLEIKIERKLGTYITQNREYSIDCFVARPKKSGLRLILELLKAKSSPEIIKTSWSKPEEGLDLDLTSTACQALEDFLKIKATL